MLGLAPQERITSWVPVPVRLATCGLLLAVSVMLSVADRCPATDGEKATPIVQAPPAATELPQVSAISAKSPGSAPEIPRLVMLKAVLLPLLRVIV
jgi:hypothetical protein